MKNLILIFSVLIPFLALAEKPVLDKEAFKKVMNDNKKRFQQCYIDYQERNGKSEGRFALNWDVDKTGKASNVEIKTDEINDPLLKNCMQEIIPQLQFPKTADGSIASVSYPFVFKSKKK